MSQLIISDFSLENLCGTDCRYEDDYLQLEQEIDKLTNIYNEPVNWDFIYNKTLHMLENQTKDFKLATWWLYASWNLYSYNSLNKNLTLYNDFLLKYNDLLFPKSLKSKINVLSWFEESITSDILNSKTQASSSIYAELYSLFLDLNQTLQKLLQEERKYFRKILDYTQPFYNEEKQKTQQKESENIKNTTQNIQEINTPTLQSGDINNETDLRNFERETKKAIAKLVEYYRQRNIHDLKTIKMTRFLSWFDIDDYPYVQNGKTTLLYPPSQLEIDQLHSLIDGKNYLEALNLCEEIIEVSPFWLEGHYLSFEILTQLNKQNEALEVKNQLIHFTQLFQGIEEYSFNDNVPFASKNTQRWLKDQQHNQSPNNTPDQTNTQNEAQLNEILELAQNKKAKEAMLLLEKHYNSAQTKEDMFFWRLEHAQLAIEFGKNKVALALLEDLLDQIKTHNLNQWNPKLASKVYILILNNFTNIDIEQNVLENVYNNLCKTDVASAMEIKI